MQTKLNKSVSSISHFQWLKRYSGISTETIPRGILQSCASDKRVYRIPFPGRFAPEFREKGAVARPQATRDILHCDIGHHAEASTGRPTRAHGNKPSIYCQAYRVETQTSFSSFARWSIGKQGGTVVHEGADQTM